MIKIITDTTCSIPRQQMTDLGIPFLPQIIIFGEESYRDDNEIDTQQFLQKLISSPTLPKTAAPPPALYSPIYQEFADKGDTMVVITPSVDVSGTYRSASIAAQDFPKADIRIIDSRLIAGGFGQLVLQAYEWVQQGMQADDLVERVKELANRNRTYFVVDTLEYLYKGGRIGKAQALFGSLLQVKPILKIQNGVTDAAESQRTKKRAVSRMEEMILSEYPKNGNSRLAISQCDALDEAQAIVDFFKNELNLKEEIPVYEMPPAIVVHAGPKVLSVSIFADTPQPQ